PLPASFAMGAFYLSLKGQLDSERSSVEFPLSLKELGAEDTPEVEEMESSVIIPASLPLESAAAAPVATSAPVAAAPPAAQLVRESRGSEQSWKGAPAAAILLGSVFAVRSFLPTRAPDAGGSHTAPAPAAQPAPAIAQPAPATPAAEVRTFQIPASRPANSAASKAAVQSPKPAQVLSTQSRPERAVAPAPDAPAQRVISGLSPAPELPVSPMTSHVPSLAAPMPVPPLAAPINTPKVEPTPAAPAVPAPARNIPEPQGQPEPHGQQSPPRVVRQINPVVPETVRRKLREDRVVQILVDVDASGKVTKAVAVSKGNKLTESLAAAAVEAARQSQFEPARQGDRRIAGQV